jgi:hypothetical protein
MFFARILMVGMNALRRRPAPAALAVALLLAVAGAVLLAARAASPTASGAAKGGTARVAEAPPARGRLICSFSNADAAAALIQGADGGQSIVVGDRTWWLFGDTLFLASSSKQIEANSIAWSQHDEAGQCPRLSYQAQRGVGTPFLAKDGSLTVWPAGAFAIDDHTLGLYIAYVYGSGPFAYWIGEVGVATLDTRTMQVTILSRSLWNANSGFARQVIGVQPIDTDATGDLRLLLQTAGSDHLLARVAPDRFADATAYTYWDGRGWSPDARTAASLWSQPQLPPQDLAGRLASFDNGVSVAYNAFLRKYVAVGNIAIDKIGARTADRLEGPWSEPTPWIDCATVAQPAVPFCYSPIQHPQLSTGGGRTLFLTFTRMATYDVVAYEVTLDSTGTPAPASDAGAAGKGDAK